MGGKAMSQSVGREMKGEVMPLSAENEALYAAPSWCIILQEPRSEAARWQLPPG
jgi:hypothetical protein